MRFSGSSSRTRRRRKLRKTSRPSLLRVNTSARNRRAIRHGIARALLVLAGLVCAALLISMGTRLTLRALLSENDLFLIRRHDIRCVGDIIKPDHVLEYASLNTYSNLFDVDIGAVRGHLVSTVPRIESVEISRYLDGVLAIEVRERVPLARLFMDGYYLEVDGDGYVLGPSAAGRRFLPVVSGHRLSGLKPGVYLGETPVMNALEVLNVCETTPIGQAIAVMDIDISDAEALRLRLADGAVVMLAWSGMGGGDEASRENMEQKLVKLIENIRQAARRGERIVEIDMTVERNFPARCVSR